MEITETIKYYYENILQRSASDDEANFWAEKVDAGEYDLEQVRDAFINSPEGQHVQDIVRLYQGSFNRVPDAGGLKSWVQSGRPLDEIAEGFTNSDEFHKLYETNEPSEAFITSLYRNVLGREPDSEGMSNWMNSGLSAHQILIGFTESVEFRGDAGAWVGKFLDRAGEGKSVYEGTLYNDAPVAGDPVALPSMEEDGGSVTFTAAELLANVKDYDADEVTVKSVAPVDPAAGELMDNGDGTWTFTPAADYNGIVTFDVVVTDGELDTPTSATLEVSPINDWPVIDLPESADVAENAVAGTVVATAMGSDVDLPEGAKVSFGIESGNERDLFEIDSETGVITLKQDAPSFEAGETEFVLKVVVSDGVEFVPKEILINLTDANDRPVVEGAEELAVDASAVSADFAQVSLTSTVTVSDEDSNETNGNFNSGSLTVSVDGHFSVGGLSSAAYGLAAGSLFKFIGNQLVADKSVINGDADLVIGTVVQNAAVDVDTGTDPSDVRYGTTGFTITFSSDAVTAETVQKLIYDLRVTPPVSTGSDPAKTQAFVTVTVADGSGSSDYFTRVVDAAGPMILANLNGEITDIAEIQVKDATDVGIDIGGNADFTGPGAVVEGMTITVSTTGAGDTLHFSNTTGSVLASKVRMIGDQVAIADVDGKETIVGTATSGGPGQDLKIVLKAGVDANDVVDTLLKNIQTDLDTDSLGTRTIDVSVTSGDGLKTPVKGSSSLTLVGNFVNTEGTAITLASILAATAVAPVKIEGNAYVSLSNVTTAVDMAQLVADGKLIVTDTPVIRFVTTVDADISKVASLGELGSYSFYKVAHNLIVSAEQASDHVAKVDAGGMLAINGVHDKLDADFSKISGAGIVSAVLATVDATDDVTFTGKLGSVPLTVTGAGDLSISAELANGKIVDHDGAGNIVISGFDGAAAYDISRVTTSYGDNVGAGKVLVDFESDVTLNNASNLATANLAATVGNNVTLTLTSAQASAIANVNGTIKGDAAVGTGNTGGSISVVFTDSDPNAAGVQVAGGLDLRALTAGGREVGSVNATNGTVSAVFTENTTLLGTANFGTAKVSVAEDKTITGQAQYLSGKEITGAGNVVATALTAIDDLSLIKVDGTKTATVTSDTSFTGNLGDFSTSVGASWKLTLDAAKATGKTIEGVASTGGLKGGSIDITGLGSTAVDFSKIVAGAGVGSLNAGTLTVSTNDTAILAAGTVLGTAEVLVGNNHVLTMSAAQANDRVITDVGADGGLVVTGLAANTDLDKIVFNGANTTVTGNVDSTIDITANTKLSDVEQFKILEGTTLTLTAAQAAQLAGVNGQIFGLTASIANDDVASVVINGDLATTGTSILNLADESGASKLTGVMVSFDDNAISVGSGTSLSVNLANLAASQTISGAGTTTVAGVVGSTDLSNVTTGTVNAIVLADANITANTKLSTVDAFAVKDGAMLTLTAAQAGSVEVNMLGSGTNGAATIIATSGDENLDMSGSKAKFTVNLGSGDDIFTGGSGDDTITGGNGQDTIRGGMGNDIIKLTEGTPAIDKVIFEATNNGLDTIIDFKPEAGGDVLDFSAFNSLDGSADFTTASNLVKVDASNFKVIIVTDPAATGWGDVKTVIDGALIAPDTTSGNAESIVVIDNGTDSHIYRYTDGVDNTDPDNPVGNSTISLLGTLNGVDASKLVAGNFDLTPFFV